MSKKICMLCKKPIKTEKELRTWYGINKHNKIVYKKYTHEDCNTKRQVGMLVGTDPENIQIGDNDSLSNSTFYGIDYKAVGEWADELAGYIKDMGYDKNPLYFSTFGPAPSKKKQRKSTVKLHTSE